MGIDYEYAFKALVHTIESEMMMWDGASRERQNLARELIRRGDYIGCDIAQKQAACCKSKADECAYLLKQAAQFC